MPFITHDQAGEIVDKIRRKFPMFEAAIAAALPDDVAPQIKP
jgi:hypothetical protein